jgi:hypothetical protein
LPTPAKRESDWGITKAVIQNEIKPKIKSIAIAKGIHLIDLGFSFNGLTDVMQSDGVHPNMKRDYCDCRIYPFNPHHAVAQNYGYKL